MNKKILLIIIMSVGLLISVGMNIHQFIVIDDYEDDLVIAIERINLSNSYITFLKEYSTGINKMMWYYYNLSGDI